MPASKKPRRKYRPKGVIVDTMDWVKKGMTRLEAIDDQLIKLKIKNHDALDTIRRGQGTFKEMDVLVSALNIADALATAGEIGEEYADEIRAGQNAFAECALRGLRGGRYVFTGPELTAVNLAMEIHDSQLDICTVSDIEAAMATVQYMHRAGKARRLVNEI